MTYIDLLANEGAVLSEPYTRQLDRMLRELRIHLNRLAVRVHLLDCLRSTNRVANGVHQDPDARGPGDRAGAAGTGPMCCGGARRGRGERGQAMSERSNWEDLARSADDRAGCRRGLPRGQTSPTSWAVQLQYVARAAWLEPGSARGRRRDDPVSCSAVRSWRHRTQAFACSAASLRPSMPNSRSESPHA